MKKLLMVCIVLVSIISFIGCDSETKSLPEGQKIAVKNSMEYIKNYQIFNKKNIKTKVVEITNITEELLRSVYSFNEKLTEGSTVDESKVDTTDWIVTIRSTDGSYVARIVCDSSTYEAIGFIPGD